MSNLRELRGSDPAQWGKMMQCGTPASTSIPRVQIHVNYVDDK
jgi:hypothetical protein